MSRHSLKILHDRAHMPLGKFAEIIRKVFEHVGLPMSAKLTSEVSDGVAPIALYCAAAPRIAADRVTVELAHRPACCSQDSSCCA